MPPWGEGGQYVALQSGRSIALDLSFRREKHGVWQDRHDGGGHVTGEETP
jgi:hypothetical protein